MVGNTVKVKVIARGYNNSNEGLLVNLPNREMEYFNELYLKEKDNVTFVMINATGDRDSKDKAKEYINNRGYSFEIYYDMELEAIKCLDIYSYPTTIFVDKDGYIDSKVVGAISKETLRNKIENLK